MKDITTLNPIEVIDRAYADGIDTWEAMVALGASDEEEMGIMRWRHGDLAMRVDRHYGDKAISKYASAIGVKYPTLKQRWGMSAYYTPDTRVSHPNLFYSHYREAKRFNDIELSLRALDKASLRDWPIWKFEQFIDRCLSKGKRQDERVEGIVSRIYSQDNGFYMTIVFPTKFSAKIGQQVSVKLWYNEGK